jgi:hypothetical protein
MGDPTYYITFETASPLDYVRDDVLFAFRQDAFSMHSTDHQPLRLLLLYVRDIDYY